MLPLLPNWFIKLVPPGYLDPDQPREFYLFTQNIIPFAPASVTTQLNTELVLSKRADVVVFGGQLTLTNAPAPGTQPTLFNPRSGASTGLMAKLANPAGNEIFTSDFVPLESLFSVWGTVGDALPFVGSPASQPCMWPIPIAVPKGGSLLMTLQQSRTDTVLSYWVRLSFWCGLLGKKRKVA